MLFPSKYNHMVRLMTGDGQEVRVLNNLFLGAADIINEELYEAFDTAEKIGIFTAAADLQENVCKHFVDKGYLYDDPNAEEKKIIAIAENYRTRDQIAAGLEGGQYGFITSLHCNLACGYCFQQKKADSTGFLTRQQVDMGLAAIAKAEENVSALLGGKKTLPKISITGGEPLLRNRENLDAVNYLMSRLEALGWPFNITTNGTLLKEFVAEHAATQRCRNVQVTLDGPREVHNQRRYYRGGGASFDKIAEGTDAALRAGWKITLRVCLDMANVRRLPELAEYIIGRGWMEYKDFSAYVSPVTDHGSICGDDTPRDEADLIEVLLNIIQENPDILKVFDIKHFRGFNYVERILVQKNPRFPVVFRCEAVTGMYIFDPMGDIHVCLEAVGDRSLRIGSYEPAWRIDEENFTRWTKRTAMTVAQCRTCKIRFICAGGCTMESFNRPDPEVCMPFLREIETAWNYFAQTRPGLFA